MSTVSLFDPSRLRDGRWKHEWEMSSFSFTLDEPAEYSVDVTQTEGVK